MMKRTQHSAPRRAKTLTVQPAEAVRVKNHFNQRRNELRFVLAMLLGLLTPIVDKHVEEIFQETTGRLEVD